MGWRSNPNYQAAGLSDYLGRMPIEKATWPGDAASPYRGTESVEAVSRARWANGGAARIGEAGDFLYVSRGETTWRLPRAEVQRLSLETETLLVFPGAEEVLQVPNDAPIVPRLPASKAFWDSTWRPLAPVHMTAKEAKRRTLLVLGILAILSGALLILALVSGAGYQIALLPVIALPIALLPGMIGVIHYYQSYRVLAGEFGCLVLRRKRPPVRVPRENILAIRPELVVSKGFRLRIATVHFRGGSENELYIVTKGSIGEMTRALGIPLGAQSAKNRLLHKMKAPFGVAQ